MKKYILSLFFLTYGVLNAEINDENQANKQIEKTFTIEKEILFSPIKEDPPIYDVSILPSFLNDYEPKFDFDDLDIDIDILDIEYNPKEIFSNKKVHRGYVKAGYTTSPSPILESFFRNTYKNNWTYSLKAQHSSRGLEWSHYHEYKNKISLQNVYFFDTFLIGNSIDLGLFKVSTPITNSKKHKENSPKTFEVTLFGRNFYEKDFFYNTEGNYNYTHLENKSYEHFFKLKSLILYEVNNSNTIIFTPEISTSKYSAPLIELNGYSIAVKGVNEKKMGKLTISYGVGITVNNHSENEQKFIDAKSPASKLDKPTEKAIYDFVVPILSVKYKLDSLTITLSPIDVEYVSHPLKHFFDQNKYLSPEEFYVTNFKSILASITVEGNFLKNFSYKNKFKIFYKSNDYGYGNYEFATGKPAYVFPKKTTSTGIGNFLDVLYRDDQNKKILKFSLGIAASRKSFEFFNMETSWIQKIGDKILFTSSFIYNIAPPSICNTPKLTSSYVQEQKNLNNILDLSFSVDYIFNDEWAFFVGIDNILMQRSKNNHPFDKPTITFSAGAKFLFL